MLPARVYSIECKGTPVVDDRQIVASVIGVCLPEAVVHIP